MYKKLLLLVLGFSMSVSVFSQYTYDAGFPVVYNILNTQCSNAGCHSATSPDALKFDGSAATVYSELYNQPPMNASALARGEQLVWVNQPYQSYLLKKAASWFDTDLGLPASEADSVHSQSVTGLTNVQVEYIRQWIMNGAAKTGLTIDTSIINAYYNPQDTGQIPFFPKLTQPNPANGVQVRFGPIFVRNTPGNNEVEYMLVRQINFPSDMEVTGVQSSMSSMSHHFLLFQFPDSSYAGAYINQGLRRVQIGGTGGIVSSFDGTKNLIAAWQTPSSIQLPTGTAFFWSKNTYIDQNYHVINYTQPIPGTSGIVPFDFYLNVSYRPRVIGDNTIPMLSDLTNNPSLLLMPNQVTTLSYKDGANGLQEMRYIWMMSSHTHKFGTGFNIYKYDNSQPGGFGDTLFKGTINYATGQDQGYYDWEHPPVEYFSPQYAMTMATNGVICQTTWNNTSGNFITFGFTSQNEMQLFYYMYTNTLPATGINTVDKPDFDFVVYPNPMSGSLGTISYTLASPSTVNASILDIAGKEVATLKNEKEAAGSYNVNLARQILASGMYFAKVSVNGVSYTKKFIVE